MADKTRKVASQALAGRLFDGMTIMAGGFGLCGIPEHLIAAIRDSGIKDLTVISNNCGVDGFGLGVLLETGQIRKMISSYVGENKLFAELYLSGKLELEFNPQGTLAERIRAGGAGIPAFFTMERGLIADLSIVKAWKGDAEGNLIYRKTARNFNPMMATAGKICVAEVEHLVTVGDLDKDNIHTPGIYVDSLVEGAAFEKRIEQRTTRPVAEKAAV